MRSNNRSLKLASTIAVIAAVITFAQASTAQKHVTGAAGSNDVERVEPIVVGDMFVYSVKMLCGTVLSDFSFRQFPSASDNVLMAPGTYLSAVNYHHPGLEEIGIENSSVILSGPVGFTVVGITPANSMGHLDCNGFISNINPGTTFEQRRSILKTEFVDGFTVLKSPVEIAVTAIYTFKNVEAPSFVFQENPVLPPRSP